MRRRHGAVGLAGRQRARLRDHARASSPAAAAAVEEQTLVARTGGAPTLAIGMSQIFSGATGEGLQAFWYHFAIMFEALFILTTVDAGTRVGRFMLQDTLGNVCKPFGRVSWKPGVWVDERDRRRRVGLLPLRRRDEPAGRDQPAVPAVRHRQPAARRGRPDRLHDAADQVRAKLKWAWVTGIPLAWDAAVTLTASYQKVFSDNPKLGFFAQRDKFQAALDAGRGRCRPRRASATCTRWSPTRRSTACWRRSSPS